MRTGLRIGAVALSALVLGVGGGCVRRPAKVLSDSRMAPLVADMELAEAYLQSQPGSPDRQVDREALLAGVLKKHKVDRETFDSTMNWYGHNLDEYYKLDGAVNRELAARRREVAEKSGGEVPVETEADDMWPYGRMAVIWEKSGSDVLPFSLAAEGVEPGSRLVWKARLRAGADMQMLLGVEYDDGVQSYVTQHTASRRQLEMTFMTDTARKVKRVFGHIAAKRTRQLPVFMDSISLRALPFDSLEMRRAGMQKLLRRPARRPVPRPVQPDSTPLASLNINSKI